MKTEKKTITIDKLVIPTLEEGRVLTVDDINGAVAVVTDTDGNEHRLKISVSNRTNEPAEGDEECE